MSRTVAEIQAEHSLKISEIMNSYLDVKDEIKATRQPEAGAYLDRLSGEQRMAALREQALGRVREAYESTLTAYTSEVGRYQEEIARRRTHLKEQVFKVEDAGALARAALATDTELGVLLELAARSSNAELGRAVFVAADQRGSGTSWPPTSTPLLAKLPAVSTRSGRSCPTKAPCKKSVMT